MKTPSTTSMLRTLPALILGLGASGVHAAGFQLIEQTASGLGNAYAGSAAIAENASTIFYNPAGMTRLPGVNASAGFALIRPSFKFSDRGSTGPGQAFPPGLKNPGTDTGGDGGSWAAVPNMYLSYQVDNNWFLGLGVGAPFGLATKYGDDWIGRYHSRKFAIQTININPSVAYKASERFSIGVGLNWQHIKAEYRRAAPHPFGANPDVAARLKAKDNSWGWNIGLLYQVTDDTRLGLSYRSRVKQKLKGNLTIRNDGTPIPGLLPAFQDLSARADVDLPDTAILSLVHELNPRWTLLADVSWTGWSSIPRLVIQSTGRPDETLELHWRDSWRFALGANYRLNEQWTLKGGIAYDQSPVDNAKYRLTSLPDNNRKWLSLGAQYHFDDATTIDVAYTHLFLSRAPIANDTEPAGKGVVNGSFRANANILGVQISHRF